jgi:hypothetical protein
MLFTDPKIQALFTAAHFKFYTLDTDPSRNIPTLYFEDASGNKGRIRQKHPSGQLIAYQGKCIREFVDPNTDKKSATPASGYQVIETGTNYVHSSGGLVGLDNTPMQGFLLSKFKDFKILDWDA